MSPIVHMVRRLGVRSGLMLPGGCHDPVERQALERRRRARWSILFNILSRGLAFLAVLFSARVALPDMGPERFGIWMTISSLLLMVTFLDFGVGNGLVAPIAAAIARDDPEEVRRIVSRGMALTACIGLLMGSTVVALFSLLPLEWLFPGTGATTLAEARWGLIVFGGLIGLTPTLGGIGRILAGMQRAYISHIANAIGSLATMALLLTLGGRGFGISAYILMTFGMVQVAAFVTGVLLWREGWLVARFLRGAAWSDYRVLLATGGMFLAVQATMVIAVGLDQTLISVTLGPAAVAGYAVAQRLFMLVSQPLYILNAPLWPAYADALHRGDHRDVRRTLQRSIFGTIAIAGVTGGLLIIAGPFAWRAVTGGAVGYSLGLMGAFALWSIVESASNALGMYLNAAHLLREQGITMILVAVVCVSAKLVALNSGSVAAVPIVGATAYAGIQLLFYAGIFRRRIMRPLTRE